MSGIISVQSKSHLSYTVYADFLTFKEKGKIYDVALSFIQLSEYDDPYSHTCIPNAHMSSYNHPHMSPLQSSSYLCTHIIIPILTQSSSPHPIQSSLSSYALIESS